MSTIYEEGRLRFTFNDDWRAVKWDDHPAFREGICKMQGTQSVDFAGHHLSTAWFIEVKDFRGHRSDNKHKFSTGSLAMAVACKVRDSIASIVWACAREYDSGRAVSKLAEVLFTLKQKPRVVLWLEQDRPLPPGEASILTNQIKKELRWLNAHVFVTCLGLEPDKVINGVEVANLPQPRTAT